MKGTATVYLVGVALWCSLTISGCSGDACKDGAVAKDGLCMPKCPGVTCGDKVCTRYYWPDGLWDKSLSCETPTTCDKDCDNTDNTLADALFFAILDIDSESFVPNPADNVSVNGTCSGGGQVAVTGSRWCQTIAGIKNCLHDLTYTFTNCAYTSGTTTLTFANGSLRGYWPYVDTGSSTAISYEVSGQPTLGGTLAVGYILDTVPKTLPSASCTVDFTRVTATTTATPVTSGTMCGRTIPVPAPTYMP
jgi:hypothetical protein